MAQSISPEDVAALMASDRLHAVIDVRSTEDFRGGQIFGSTTLALAELEARLPALVPVTSVEVVVLDADAAATERAAEACERLGYEAVRALDGGYAGWLAAGQPTETGWSVLGKDMGERLLMQEPVPEIDADELAAKLERGDPVIVLDSRTPAEFERSCIPGARSVPGGELPLEISDLLADPAAVAGTVVVNCAGRTRSILGAYQLRRMGVQNAVALRNGTMGWMLSGHELQTGATGWQPVEHSTAAVDRAEHAASEIAERDGVELIDVARIEELRAAADRDPLYIVDVRMPHEYLEGHIPGALTCPGGQVAFSDDQIAIRGANLVVVCDGRARAIFAGSLWRQMGFPRVYALDGGVGAWTGAGHDLERGGEERPFVGGGTRTREQMIEYLRWEEELGEKYASS